MKKFLIYILCVMYCLSVLGCSNSPQINRKLLPMSDSGGGITYGLYGMDGEIETETHFKTNSNSSFQKIFSFGNLIEVEREYKLLIFANYQQISFSVDDKEFISFYDFAIKPYEHSQFTITFPTLDEGYYDLLFVIVKDPNNINLDDSYRKQTDMSHLITIRYSLSVGEEHIYDDYEVTKYNSFNDTALDGVFLNQDNPELKRLLSVNCSIAEKPKLYIHIGNQSERTKEFVVFLLYDWNQISIDEKKSIYVSVPPESRVVIPFNLSPEEGGIHNLTAICVEEPLQKTTIYSRRADFSIRVGINVVNERE